MFKQIFFKPPQLSFLSLLSVESHVQQKGVIEFQVCVVAILWLVQFSFVAGVEWKNMRLVSSELSKPWECQQSWMLTRISCYLALLQWFEHYMCVRIWISIVAALGLFWLTSLRMVRSSITDHGLHIISCGTVRSSNFLLQTSSWRDLLIVLLFWLWGMLVITWSIVILGVVNVILIVVRCW